MHESGGMQSQLPMCWRKDDLNCGPKIASVLILEESKHQQSVETECQHSLAVDDVIEWNQKLSKQMTVTSNTSNDTATACQKFNWPLQCSPLLGT